MKKKAKLRSEVEVVCPCCDTALTVDLNLKRIVRYEKVDRSDKPELNDAERILAEEATRREAVFQQSVNEEKTRADGLARRFEEALREAKNESAERPVRDFDFD